MILNFFLRDRSLIIVRGGSEVSGGGSCILQWSKGVGLAFFSLKRREGWVFINIIFKNSLKNNIKIHSSTPFNITKQTIISTIRTL